MAYYLDTSALVKLVVAEPETAAIRTWLAEADRDLARTQLLRAVRRSAPNRVAQARSVLDSITLIEVTAQTFEEAAWLDPTMLRTLDAIHLAAALDLGDDLDGIVSTTRLGRGVGLASNRPAVLAQVTNNDAQPLPPQAGAPVDKPRLLDSLERSRPTARGRADSDPLAATRPSPRRTRRRCAKQGHLEELPC